MKVNYKIVKLSKIGNPDEGYLSFFQFNREIDFPIRRIYYVYETNQNVTRGMHAHKKNNQFLWCPYGEIEVLVNDGYSKEIIILDNPSYLLSIKPGIWHEMKWKISNSVLCVVASDDYDENDYIRNFNDFMIFVKKGYWNNESKF
jgi:dTDP-4-dehydrorhamnose 3,5-epimerase-like enzyme